MTTKKSTATATSATAGKTPVKKAPVKKPVAKKAPEKNAAAPAKPAAKPVEKAAVKIQVGTAPKQAAKKAKKNHKEKVVRDSFTMPHSEYRQITGIKETCLKAGMHVKKSEVLRAGLKALLEKDAAQLLQSLRSLEKIQTGRPKKH